MKALERLAFALAMFGFCNCTAGAYEIQTHRFLTADAAPQSVLGDLGLPAYTDTSASYVASDGSTGNALQILMQGSTLEDNAPRYLNHFFDPQYNGFVGRGLQFGPGLDSPDWALQDRGVQADPKGNTNAFAYRSAEAAFYAGLTSSSPTTRNQYFSTMFESLGHIVHHIEDMAQPQHTT